MLPRFAPFVTRLAGRTAVPAAALREVESRIYGVLAWPLGRLVTIAFKFIPYRLGIDEAGSGAVAQVIGIGPAAGVTLALVRRLRILVINAIGLVRLARV